MDRHLSKRHKEEVLSSLTQAPMFAIFSEHHTLFIIHALTSQVTLKFRRRRRSPTMHIENKTITLLRNKVIIVPSRHTIKR